MIYTHLDNFDPRSIMDSGQCFRITQISPNVYRVLALGDELILHDLGGGNHAFACDEMAYQTRWRPYFDLETDYAVLLHRVEPTDEFLRKACVHGAGLRILRQDPWETLVSFILSQRKSIPAIRTSIEALCARFGRALSGGQFAFPTPEALACAEYEELAACSLGYRTAYVRDTARRVASGEADLAAWRALDDEALRAALMTLPGVGIKIALCVMLFGYHRLSAAPVDVWIARVIEEQYAGRSPFAHYGEYAGVIQQYLFYYRRSLKI